MAKETYLALVTGGQYFYKGKPFVNGVPRLVEDAADAEYLLDTGRFEEVPEDEVEDRLNQVIVDESERGDITPAEIIKPAASQRVSSTRTQEAKRALRAKKGKAAGSGGGGKGAKSAPAKQAKPVTTGNAEGPKGGLTINKAGEGDGSVTID